MKKKCFHLLIIVLTLIYSSCKLDNKVILNETFEKNTRGWIEETSDYHSVAINNGQYFIESKDTSNSTTRTSAGSLDKSYLYDLPNKYDLEFKIKLENTNLNNTSYGILLFGAMYEYSFNFYKSGIVQVLEYDYNSKMEYNLFSDTSNYEFKSDLKIKISIDSSAFRLFIEDYEIAQSKFNVKSWQDLRVFTSSQSKIVVDYIRINEIEQ